MNYLVVLGSGFVFAAVIRMGCFRIVWSGYVWVWSEFKSGLVCSGQRRYSMAKSGPVKW